MDTSETYIQMCEKAEELQTLRSITAYNRQTHQYENGGMWDEGDVFWADGEDYVYGGNCYTLTIYDGKIDLGSAGYCEGDGRSVRQVVWLPRQDQLQEMISLSALSYLLDELYSCYVYYTDGVENDEVETWSMEQLWLAFVMKGKYNKVWDGEEWNSLA